MVSCSVYFLLVEDDSWFEYLFIAGGASVFLANLIKGTEICDYFLSN